jgi:hypothetical protein
MDMPTMLELVTSIVIATEQTLAIMSARYGANFARFKTALSYNEKFRLGGGWR